MEYDILQSALDTYNDLQKKVSSEMKDWDEYVNKKFNIKQNNFEQPDLIYILLTWNGLYIPYNHDFSHHLDPAHKMIRHIHLVFPKAKVRIMGIQICSVNGGIASNYGASGPYSDTFGTISTAFFYNEALEKMTKEEEFKDYVSYIDTKAQFDTAWNNDKGKRKIRN